MLLDLCSKKTMAQKGFCHRKAIGNYYSQILSILFNIVMRRGDVLHSANQEIQQSYKFVESLLRYIILLKKSHILTHH